MSFSGQTGAATATPAPAAPVTALATGARRSRRSARVLAGWLPRPELAALMVLAAILYLWALGRNGWANDYYSAAVRSMSSSWHNFLYASFDRSGVMTVDKPPLALWVQSLSVRVFGYHPLSMLVPQALMGVASVVLVYDLVRRRFGRLAGFLAGLALAVTPMTVAISRHNNPDALLVLCCVAALWCAVRALEHGRARWLVLSGVCVGLGFETKMGVALTVVPGIALAWMLLAPGGRPRALRDLLAGGAAMVLVGGAWPALVELTPASARPWVAGTSDNSVLSLIFGYNGLGRVDGQSGGPGGGGALFGSTPGPLRLLNSALGGQAGWLLGFALVSCVGLLFTTRLRRADPRSGWLIAVGGAFLVTAVLFSWASGIFHPYYVSLLAPFAAALVGAGSGELLRGGVNPRIFGPLALAAGVAGELVVLGNYPGQLTWLPALLIAVGALAAFALVALDAPAARVAAVSAAVAALMVAPSAWAVDTLGHATSGTFPAGGPASVQAGVGGSLLGGPRTGGAFAGGPPIGAPMAGEPPSGPLSAGGVPPTPGGPLARGPLARGPLTRGPLAGGPLAGGPTAGGPFGEGSLTHVLSYIKQHGGGTLAVASQSSAASAIITRNADVAGIGGFSGRESDVSVSWLAQQVRSGRIRWVLAERNGPAARLPGDNRTGARAAMATVARVCRAVTLTGGTSPASSAGSGSLAGATTGRGSLGVARLGARIGAGTLAGTLYDCQGRSAQLLRAGA
jgi:4-amino-4-deoxy-L-arabinose transferase-like glycosyltransferase